MELVPARMLNEVVYCPRLFALEHVDGEWADSHDTVRGQTVHRRVDHGARGHLPEPEVPQDSDEPPSIARSVHLGDPTVGIVAKIDLVEAGADGVVPVDYKKSKAPTVPEGAWLPERVQVCAQALLLRAHGYQVPYGMLYFAGSKRRVRVDLDEELVTITRGAVDRARAIIASEELPEPLFDSPKCVRCSLVGICLPDETHHLRSADAALVRPIAPAHEQGLPLYVMERGAKLALRSGEILVTVKGKEVDRVRLAETSRVVVMGAASVTTPLMAKLAGEGIPLAVHGWGSKLMGQLLPAGGHNVQARIAQHRVAFDPPSVLPLARAFIVGKIANQRVLLRRNARGVDDALGQLADFVGQAGQADSVATLLGIEGMAARVYFQHFAHMFKTEPLAFDLDGRNRRPPKDPVNAMLSFAYACLARECTSVLHGVGLDPWVGLLHRPRPGKPALALDLMEEFRPIVADSTVLSAINNGIVGPDDFHRHRLGVAMTSQARRAFVRAFERRLAEEATHTLFGTRMSYRRIMEVQARLIAKALRADIPRYRAYRVR
jgi:CRISPR-associated protein Cas1